MTEKISQWQAADFLQACQAAQIPAGRVNTMPEAMALARARGLLLEGDGLAAVRTVAFGEKGEMGVPPGFEYQSE